MFFSQCVSDIKAEVNVFDGESEEPIIVRLGEIGVHMTRDEALELYSGLEKAIHSLVAVTETKWTVQK